MSQIHSSDGSKINVQTLQQFEAEMAKAGMAVSKGVAVCPCCSQRNGYTIVGEVKFVTCFKCGTRMRKKKGPPNGDNRNEKGWEIHPD